MADKKLFVYQCADCRKVFRTTEEGTKLCTDCDKARGLSAKGASVARKTRKKKRSVLSISDISFLQRQFTKAHKRPTSYGHIVEAINYRPNDCVVCGEYVPEGTHICSECKKL